MENITQSQNLGLGGRGAHLAIPSIIGPCLASVLVFNRIYWRIRLVHTIGLDDMCIVFSLLFLFAHCLVNIIAVDHGYGRPAHNLSPSDLHLALEMFYFDQIFYKFTINLTKLSILCLYLRIFTAPWFRTTCWVSVLLITFYALSSIIATVFQCTPIPRFWDKTIDGMCISSTAFWFANSIFNIVTDIVILGSVPGVVWSLSLPMRQRVGLTVVFGLGVFVFVTSVLRMTTLDVGSKSSDPTHGPFVSTVWTAIEASTAVVCACLPMVRTPIQKLFPRLFPGAYASGSGRGRMPQQKQEKRQRDPVVAAEAGLNTNPKESAEVEDETLISGAKKHVSQRSEDDATLTSVDGEVSAGAGAGAGAGDGAGKGEEREMTAMSETQTGKAKEKKARPVSGPAVMEDW